MERNTITMTVQSELCCGCGICKALCPSKCISWEKRHGIYVPHICEEQCLKCGLCASVCPGLGHDYETHGSAIATITGSVKICYNAWSKDDVLRYNCASGGVVSTLVRKLLGSGEYDGVFCVDSYDYREQVRTQFYSVKEVMEPQFQLKTPKSRYLPVSHENAISYIMEHREERLILIGTSCAIRGLVGALTKMGRKREQHLFIGLFCDKVFNYNVLPYFENTSASGRKIKELHFKNKESGGWPGNMKFFPENGTPFYASSSERVKAKDYFMVERCLYCVDKLNVYADISLGDNYTKQDDPELGSNSVIIRTEKGLDAWELVCDNLEICPVDITSIQKAQSLGWRMNNLYFGDLKTNWAKLELNRGVTRENEAADYRKAWESALRKLGAGAIYDSAPEVLEKEMCKEKQKSNPVIRFAGRVVRYIRRNIK